MTIWLVEDNYLQASDICEDLQKAFPTEFVKRINTEYEFYQKVDEIARDKTAFLVLDIMLRWCMPAPNMPKRPDRVKEEGVYKAGFRCLEELAKQGPPAIPVILYTVLDEDDIKSDIERIPPGYESITYSTKSETSGLVKAIRDHSPFSRRSIR